MFLTLIKPPNNANTCLLNLKRDFYRRTGYISAWALPPAVPVAEFSDFNLELSRKDLPGIPEQGLTLSGLFEADGQCWLGSSGLRSFAELTAGLFKTCEGFRSSSGGLHLYDISEAADEYGVENRRDLKERFSGLPAPVINWGSCSLEIWRTSIHVFWSPEWWKRLDYEIILQLNFPKPRRQ